MWCFQLISDDCISARLALVVVVMVMRVVDLASMPHTPFSSASCFYARLAFLNVLTSWLTTIAFMRRIVPILFTGARFKSVERAEEV